MIKNYSKLFLTISIIFFLVSLTQKAFCVNNDCEYYGFLALIYGFFGFFDGGAGITWLANPIILVSWITFNKKKSIYFNLAAFILGISFLFFEQILMGTNNKYGQITNYELGYYLWLLSFLTMLIGNIFDYIKK